CAGLHPDVPRYTAIFAPEAPPPAGAIPTVPSAPHGCARTTASAHVDSSAMADPPGVAAGGFGSDLRLWVSATWELTVDTVPTLWDARSAFPNALLWRAVAYLIWHTHGQPKPGPKPPAPAPVTPGVALGRDFR